MPVFKIEPDKYDEYERLTIESYDRNAENWTNTHEGGTVWDKELERFQKKFLKSGSVIDIGCGSGRDLRKMYELGFDCVGVDASKALLEIAKNRLPAAEFINLNLYDIGTISKRFDGFVSVATLLHIPRNKTSQALQTIAMVLKPKAKGLIILKEGAGEEFEIRDIDERHEERLFVFWQKDEFIQVLSTNKYRVLDYFEKQIGRSNWSGYFVEYIG